MNINEAKNYIYNLGGTSRGLSNFEEFLAKYDNPHKKYKTIQVLGTNGKGSTTAMLASLISNKYKNVATFTSPAIIDVYDRIQINRVDILETEFLEIFNSIYEDAKLHQLGFFEVLCAIAFIHFANNKVEYAIIEAGLGGLNDCTSVISPEVRLLTNVGYDHTEILGDSLEEILLQKLGACINDDTLITTINDDTQMSIIDSYCKTKNITCKYVDYEIDYELNLIGEHQKKNAALAYECSKYLDLNLSEDQYMKSFSSVVWRGRFEKINENFYIDGAHNIDGAKISVATANNVFGKNNYVIVSSVLRGKNLMDFYDIFKENASNVIFTTFDFPRALTKEELDMYDVNIDYDLDALIKQALSGNSNYLFTGSLYFVTEILMYLRGQDTND